MQPNSDQRQNLLYNESAISEIYERNLERANASLRNLEVFCGSDYKGGGLSGWVFEQTVQFCLRKELEDQGIQAEYQEQVSLGGKRKADLAIDKVAIEIKLRGLFSTDDIERYNHCNQAALQRGLHYLFLTKEESHRPYREAITASLGVEKTFFLDTPDDWGRFVTTVAAEITKARRLS